MNVAKELVGQRIAKHVIAETEAKELLAKPSPLTKLGYVLYPIGGAGLGASLGAYQSPYAQVLLGVVAGVALYVGAFAYNECRVLRRRLDAALLLLQNREG